MAAPRSATGTLLKSDLREDLREPVALDALGAALAFFAAGLATVFFLAGAAFLAFFAGAYGYKSWRGVWKNFPRRQRALTFFTAGLAAAGFAAGLAAGLGAAFFFGGACE